MAHAKLSPSASHRWMGCPGSVAFNRDFPEESSEYAAEGTFAHSIAADCLQQNCNADALIGYTDDAYTCDEEMAAHVQVYLDEVRLRLLVPTPVLAVEERVTLKGLVPDVRGTADAAVISADRKQLDVFDFKYGAGVFVPVEGNPQLRIYALGFLLSWAEQCAKVERVAYHIVQPRHHQGGHHMEKVARNELVAWGQDVLLPAAKATKAADAPLKPGDHCRWCPGKAACPALQKESLEVARQLFSDDEMTRPAPSFGALDPSDMSPGKLSTVLKIMPRIREWMSAVETYAYQEANHGRVPPGFKLVRKKTHRKWIDGEYAAGMLKQASIDPYKRTLISPAQAEKKTRDPYLIAKLSMKPVGDTVLADEKDSRPAVDLQVFDQIPEQNS